MSSLITIFGRESAFNFSPLCWITGGILSLILILFAATDEKKMHQNWPVKMVYNTANVEGKLPP